MIALRKERGPLEETSAQNVRIHASFAFSGRDVCLHFCSPGGDPTGCRRPFNPAPAALIIVRPLRKHRARLFGRAGRLAARQAGGQTNEVDNARKTPPLRAFAENISFALSFQGKFYGKNRCSTFSAGSLLSLTHVFDINPGQFSSLCRRQPSVWHPILPSSSRRAPE